MPTRTGGTDRAAGNRPQPPKGHGTASGRAEVSKVFCGPEDPYSENPTSKVLSEVSLIARDQMCCTTRHGTAQDWPILLRKLNLPSAFRRHHQRLADLDLSQESLQPVLLLRIPKVPASFLNSEAGGDQGRSPYPPQPRHSYIRLSPKLPGGLFRKSNSRLMWVVTPGSLAHRGPSLPYPPIWGLTNSTVLRASVRARSPSSRV